MTANATYRVVGVRADKSRMVICQKVTKQQAERIRTSLDNGSVFRSVEIEPDDESTPELDLHSDS